jgi:hypothetical protein
MAAKKRTRRKNGKATDCEAFFVSFVPFCGKSASIRFPRFGRDYLVVRKANVGTSPSSQADIMRAWSMSIRR